MASLGSSLPDLRIRLATPEDYPEFTRLFPELGVDDPVITKDRWQRDLAAFTWIAVRGEAVVGYCYCQEMADRGYVRQLVVDPRARGQGVGRALMLRAAARLQRKGLQRWCLNVMTGNQPALRLYGSLGLRPRYRSVALRCPWTIVDRLPEPAFAPVVRSLAPEADAAMETAFSLATGQLAQARGRERLLFQIADAAAGEVLGLAVFDPGFPGAFPFRLRRPDLARPLLRADRKSVV